MMKAESERAKEADIIREKEQYHERVSDLMPLWWQSYGHATFGFYLVNLQDRSLVIGPVFKWQDEV